MKGRTAVIMHRSFAGDEWPPDIAMVVNGKPVTWAEVHKARQERQERILAWKRRRDPPRIEPCYVWSFFVPGWLYGGWHGYIVTFREGRQHEVPVNFQTGGRFSTVEGPSLAESIMREMPLGLLPIAENWDRWLEALAERYPRRHPHDPRKAGSRVGWLIGRKRFSLAKPSGQRELFE